MNRVETAESVLRSRAGAGSFRHPFRVEALPAVGDHRVRATLGVAVVEQRLGQPVGGAGREGFAQRLAVRDQVVRRPVGHDAAQNFPRAIRAKRGFGGGRKGGLIYISLGGNLGGLLCADFRGNPNFVPRNFRGHCSDKCLSVPIFFADVACPTSGREVL